MKNRLPQTTEEASNNWVAEVETNAKSVGWWVGGSVGRWVGGLGPDGPGYHQPTISRAAARLSLQSMIICLTRPDKKLCPHCVVAASRATVA